MREARTALAVAGTFLLAGCGGGGAPSQAVTLTPTVGMKSVMECLSQEAEKLEYKITMVDKDDGHMIAERRDKDPAIGNPREYAGGDMITVDRGAKQGDVRPLAIKPSSFIMEWLANGANRKNVSTTERARADANTLAERCRL